MLAWQAGKDDNCSVILALEPGVGVADSVCTMLGVYIRRDIGRGNGNNEQEETKLCTHPLAPCQEWQPTHYMYLDHQTRE
jgi:hypothetical protein